MNLPAAVLLGILQGLTEFLPVSSSAHLILARAFFGWETPPEFGLAFDVALHVGTLAAIVLFFRREVFGMAAAVPAFFRREPDPSARLLENVAVATIPVVIVGLLFNDFIEQVLRTPAVAAGALAVGAVAMLPWWARLPLRLPYLPVTERLVGRPVGGLATAVVRWAMAPAEDDRNDPAA